MRKLIVALIGALVFAVLLPLAGSAAHASPVSFSRIATAEQATAAVKCKGRSCTGKNPQKMECGEGARTIATTRPGGGGPKVELRYSKKCRAAWARLQKTPAWAFMLDVKGHPNYTAFGSSQYKAYTKMAGKPLKSRACVKQWSSDAWNCTRWR